MRLLNFFRECENVLNDNDAPAAFYFEMIVEHLEEGKDIPSDKRGVERMLGL